MGFVDYHGPEQSRLCRMPQWVAQAMARRFGRREAQTLSAVDDPLGNDVILDIVTALERKWRRDAGSEPTKPTV
jgi:hypothetical protein